MRVITLAGSPRFPSRSSSLLEYAPGKTKWPGCRGLSLEFAKLRPGRSVYARFDSPALKTFTEQLQQADGLIVATPRYKAAYSGALKTARPAARTCVARQSGAAAGDRRHRGPSAGGRLCP